MRRNKGQGALEYLLLIGGAVLIAVIVIALLVGMGSQSKDSAQDQTTKAQKIVNVPQATSIASVYAYQDGDDCLADGCHSIFQNLLNAVDGCEDNSRGHLKLTWDSLSSGGTYIIKIYDYMENELQTYIYPDVIPPLINNGEITGMNPVYLYVQTVDLDCQDSYYAQIHTVKDGQTVKSAKYKFNW